MQKTKAVIELLKSCAGGGLASPVKEPELPEISKDTPMVFDRELCIFVIAPRRHGKKLTQDRAAECERLSGDAFCQACGEDWENHHENCEGSDLTPNSLHSQER